MTASPPHVQPHVQPHITLNNGGELTALGLGVFQSPPAETATSVEAALAAGYRLIDTAAAYFNERGVGEGICRSGLPRDDVFIETKVWISDYGYDATLHAFDKSARKLGVDRLDLLLLHAGTCRRAGRRSRSRSSRSASPRTSTSSASS